MLLNSLKLKLSLQIRLARSFTRSTGGSASTRSREARQATACGARRGCNSSATAWAAWWRARPRAGGWRISRVVQIGAPFSSFAPVPRCAVSVHVRKLALDLRHSAEDYRG
jgi:hypothetical protein